MKRLIQSIAIVAMLNLGAGLALADDPQVSVDPVVQPSPQSPAAGGSASASGGSAGPAVISSSQPVTVSNSTSPAAGTGDSHGSTTASAPGTSANVPLGASTAEPDPSAPDGAPATTTSGPTADADASRTSVTTNDSGVHVTIISTATGAFGAFADGVGSAQDPTNASTCTTADVSPGVPTGVSLGTACGGGSPSAVSEDYAASGSGGYGTAGTPSAASCLGADASVGVTPSAGLADACSGAGTTPSAVTTPSTGAGDTGGGAVGTGTTGLATERAGTAWTAEAGRQIAAALLAFGSLPFTGTAPEAPLSLGGLIAVAGLVLLGLRRRIAGSTWESASAVRVD